MINLFKKKEQKQESLEFTWKPEPINKKGKETINDMSLIRAMYEDFILTKTGFLVAGIEISGVNLELLNNEEQRYIFETFNTFLINTLGDNSNECQQWLDTTSPVDMEKYILSYKKRYLTENNPARKRLIASYIYDLQNRTNRNEMNTKRHILIIKEKINDKSIATLESTALSLNDKVRHYIARIEDSFEQYDVQAKKLFSDEMLDLLKNQINFNGK